MTGVDGLGARSTRLIIPILLVLLIALAVGWTQDADVDDETCLTCHEGLNEHLKITAHRLSSETEAPTADIACVSCHWGAAEHIEDPSTENIINPDKALIETQLQICAQCHQPHKGLGQVGWDPHAENNIACTECHSIHSGTLALLVENVTTLCGNCHVATSNDFFRNSNHPLTDEVVTCLSCHDFKMEHEPMYGYGISANCYRCHPLQSEPHPYPHEAISSFSVEGEDGCMSCHRPHGSPNDRLLTQTGNNLCLQCHFIPPSHRTAHDGIGVQFQCMECHTAVHGSFVNRFLLDPNLGAELPAGPETCFCHGVD